MDKGRTGVENFALSKPTWEIMKIIWEITDFCRDLIFGAIFGVRTLQTMWKTIYNIVRWNISNMLASLLFQHPYMPQKSFSACHSPCNSIVFCKFAAMFLRAHVLKTSYNS